MTQRISTDKQNKILALHKQGLSCRAISVAVGVGATTVRREISPNEREKDLAYRMSHRSDKAEYYTINKAVLSEKNAAYRATHKGTTKRYSAQYYKDHAGEIKQRVSQYQRERAEEIAQYQAEYSAKHKVEKARYYAGWYSEHIEETRQYSEEYRRTHKDEIRRSKAKYRLSHLPEETAHGATRRALKAGSLIGSTPEELSEIKEIYRRAKEDKQIICYLCGELVALGDRHVDHILPLSKGGAHRPSNLSISCSHCNLSKSDKMPWEVAEHSLKMKGVC